MAFYGYDFVFGGVPSETYCLEILNYGGTGGLINSPFGSDVELVTDKVRRKPVPYFYGVEQTPVLEFPLTFGVARQAPIDAWDRRSISQFMFGRNNYQWLNIIQDDLLEVRFRCFFTEPEVIAIGNMAYAFTCTVVCDAPWAWSYEEHTRYNIVGSNTIDFYNSSDSDYYLFPELDIKPSEGITSFTIENETDNNRQFILSGLDVTGNEIIHVDNERQIITSNEGYNRFQNFNKKWLRLLPRINRITITGDAIVNITCIYPRKVGG